MWEENPKGRDWKPNPHVRLWSEVGFKPGSTEVKGRGTKPLSQPDSPVKPSWVQSEPKFRLEEMGSLAPLKLQWKSHFMFAISLRLQNGGMVVVRLLNHSGFYCAILTLLCVLFYHQPLWPSPSQTSMSMARSSSPMGRPSSPHRSRRNPMWVRSSSTL